MSSQDVVIPPHGPRSLIEKTALAVAKTPALESIIIRNKAGEPRFSFFLPSDPYHSYYLSKVSQSRSDLRSKSDPVPSDDLLNSSNPGPDSDPLPSPASVPTSAPGPVDDVQEVAPAVSKLKSARLKAEHASHVSDETSLSEDAFTLPSLGSPPSYLTLDVIKLVAQYTFRYGHHFSVLLGRKEERNPLFGFLNPLHPNYVLFKRVLDAYTLIGHRDADSDAERQHSVASLRAQSISKKATLDSIWRLFEVRKKQRQEVDENGDGDFAQSTGASIDWHEFVVLETIDLGENETGLPAPLADPSQIPHALAASDAARREWEKNRSDIDMDMDMDGGVEARPDSSTMVVAPDVDVDIPTSRVRKAGAGMRSERSHRGMTEVKGLQNGLSAGTAERVQDVRLPDGRVVPETDAALAMRAQLLDPKYKDEKQRAAKKNQRQNLADDAQMALQLARLNNSKPDTGVYNRGDLQGQLAGRCFNGAGAVGIPAPTATGPQLPDGSNQPAKRARVEAAVDALNQASASKSARIDSGNAKDAALLPMKAGAAAAGTATSLIPEADWLAKVGDKIAICVKVPVHGNADWKLSGQEINLEVPLRSSVLKLKEVLSKAACTKVPANKQKLQYDGFYLSNRRSLAYCNVVPGGTLTLEVKERGGKKRV